MPPKPAYRRRFQGRAPGQAQASFTKQVVSATKIQKAVRTYLNKQIETKRSNTTSTDGLDIGHNSFQYLDSNILITTQGTTDPTAGNTANRIGDEINLKGVAFKIMLENNHRYPDVTFRIMVIKSAKGDVPTTATLFNGLSGNKMMDTFNNERYTLLFSKYVKVRNPNFASVDALGGASYVGSGLQAGSGGVTSPGTRIVKFYIPGKKFVGKSGIVRYENGTSQVKFHDYTVLVYAYSTIATSELLGWNVGKVNEYIKIMYFKDA